MLIPGPDTRVVELRVHGILGTTPEDLVEAVAAVDVAGDGIGRLVRPADRLRRPAPGPVLKADGRPLPRTLEGYVWGAMTSGGAAKAIWALLFPFSLANVASWMLPPVRPDSVASRTLGWWCRAMLRLAALLLTMLLVGQLAAASLDLFAAQCLAPGSGCLGPVAPGWFRDLPMVRTAIGLAPLALIVYVINRVSTVNWACQAGPRPDRVAGAPEVLARLPGAGKVADPDAPALRALHLAGSLGLVAVLAVGGPFAPEPGVLARVCWTGGLVLVGLCLAGALVFADPTGVRWQRTRWWSKLGVWPGPRRALLIAGWVLLALVVAAVPHPAGPLPGTDPTLNTVTLALVGAAVLLGVLLAPFALLARPGWAAQPAELRPWAGGWIAVPFLALAGFLGAGFGAGVGIAVRGALGGSPLALPPGYAYLTLLWGIAAVLGVLGAVALVITLVVRRVVAARTGRGIPPEVRLLHEGRPGDMTRAASAWWWADWERGHAHRAIQGLALVLSVGALVSGVPWLSGALPPTWTEPLSGIGFSALLLLAGALLREVYVAARKPSAARHLGGLADLACFWPREAHPIVPPCYALKVVPELAERATEYLKDPGARVVLAGHSQGTVLVAAAMARLLATSPETDRQRLGLVVAGSPLQWAYPRAFPAVVPHDGLMRLYGTLNGRWRALCRGTDPIGGGLTTWRRQVVNGKLIGIGFLDDGPFAPPTGSLFPNSAAGAASNGAASPGATTPGAASVGAASSGAGSPGGAAPDGLGADPRGAADPAGTAPEGAILAGASLGDSPALSGRASADGPTRIGGNWGTSEGSEHDGSEGALPPAVTGPTGALVLGGDHWLPDPERGPFPGRRWAAGVQRHDDYYSDPEWDRAIACASGLESPTSTANEPLLFRLPGRKRAQ